MGAPASRVRRILQPVARSRLAHARKACSGVDRARRAIFSATCLLLKFPDQCVQGGLVSFLEEGAHLQRLRIVGVSHHASDNPGLGRAKWFEVDDSPCTHDAGKRKVLWGLHSSEGEYPSG